MRLVDLYPTCGTFSPGEPIQLIAEVEVIEASGARIQVNLFHLAKRTGVFEFEFDLVEGTNRIQLEFEVASIAPRGYGVQAVLVEIGNAGKCSAMTAFDVLDSWTDYPRYGFLTDFVPNREDVDATVADLARFHINGLQFYDWQFRHDTFLPPSETYNDPLGRELSLDTVKQFIRAAHHHGIAAMPYLTVYAASKEFWADRPAWRLHDEDGEPLMFESFLGLMNPSPGSPWVEHILEECERMLAVLDFDGLHIDQYGDPKSGLSADGDEVDLATAFQDFIAASRDRLPKSVLTFNAVSNWPIDALAPAPLDFNYIEIWPDTPTFRDLQRITLESRLKSGDKPFVIALYLPTDQETNIRLVDAIIFASGGCRIELGERNRLLTDPYFPKHQPTPPELDRVLRQYYDFAVRYGEWIGPSAGDTRDQMINLPEGVWGITREVEGWLVLHLINMTGLDEARWDEETHAPTPLDGLTIEIWTSRDVSGVWQASPDRNDLTLTPAEWRMEGDRVVVNTPNLDYWSMLAVQIETVE